MIQRAAITEITLRDFRNHILEAISPAERLTVLKGMNTAGKTNILEAIALTTRGASFRPFSWSEAVRAGQTEASVHVKGTGGRGEVEIGLRINRSGKREFSVNRVLQKSASGVIGRLPTVSFVPDDLQLAKGPPEVRRAALDILGSQMSEAYATLRAEYLRTLRHRNALLKRGGSADETHVWDAHLVEAGSAFFQHRMRLMARVSRHLEKRYGELAEGEALAVTVDCSFSEQHAPAAHFAQMAREDIKEGIREALGRTRETERERGMTLVGPHRDDVTLAVDGFPARGFASQGQQRTIALAWKMAEVATVAEVSGTEPVLLLDDVMSELDERRRKALETFIASGPQTVVTTTTLSYFDSLSSSETLVVEVAASG